MLEVDVALVDRLEARATRAGGCEQRCCTANHPATARQTNQLKQEKVPGSHYLGGAFTASAESGARK
jgi:hypothetical protein